MEKKKILLVDDDPGVLECLHEILSRQGYEPASCSNASSALALVSSGAPFALAIIDLILPDMNGLECHARIKQLRPDLPCIVATGHCSVESYLTALSNGVFEYLNKPFRSRELQAVVGAAIGKAASLAQGRPDPGNVSPN